MTEIKIAPLRYVILMKWSNAPIIIKLRANQFKKAASFVFEAASLQAL